MIPMIGKQLDALEPGMVVLYSSDARFPRRVLPDGRLIVLLDEPGGGAKAGDIMSKMPPEWYTFVRWEDSDDPNGR